MSVNTSKFNRRVHMDFHTPAISWDKAMKNFNAKEYVDVLEGAGLNSVVSFIKCHHGFHYSKTEVGTRHPSLPDDVDIFGDILKEGQSRNMAVMAYYSIGWLTPVQRFHPEWMERDIDGDTQGTQGQKLAGPWANICLNSPYLDDMVLPELKEFITNYNIDTLWLDIIECQPCYCEHCEKKYNAMYGKSLPKDRAELTDFVVQTKYDFIAACRKLLKSIKPDVPMTYNTSGRDERLIELVDFNSIETHPGAPEDADAWAKSLLTYKYLQSFNKPWESCTSRFIHGWGGWDDQTRENMTVVTSRINAHGGMINLGDQAYPDATVDAALYEKIKHVFSYLKEREGYCLGKTSYPYVALLTGNIDIYAANNDNYIGAVKTLSQKQIPFDVLLPSAIDNINNYRCVVVPEVGILSDKTLAALTEYVNGGGNLLITGRYENEDKLKPLCGVTELHEGEYSIGYIKLDEKVSHNIRKSALLIPTGICSVNITDQAQSLAEAINPVIEPDYFDFFMFRHPKFSPPGDSTGRSAMTFNSYGKGKVVYSPLNMFAALNTEGQWYIKDIIANVAELLLTEKPFKLTSPSTVEFTATQDDKNIYLHLIQYALQNGQNHVEELIPADNITIEVDATLINADKGATLLPENTPLAIEIKDGKAIINPGQVTLHSTVMLAKA